MNSIRTLVLTVLLTVGAIAQTEADRTDDEAQGFRIDEPGTITFTTAMKIEGKIDKPQVVIFLPKEERHYREITFSHSFEDEIMRALPFTPKPE